MKKQLVIFLILIFVFVSCTNHNSESKQEGIITKIPNQDSIIIKPYKIDYSDSINYTDENGLRQGKWIDMWEGKVAGIKTYINDTLNGCFFRGVIEEKNYSMLSYFNMGECIWSAFGYDHQLLFPTKGFTLSKDTVLIQAPYYNGQLWYEGKFIKIGNKRKYHCSVLHNGVGIHKVYYENGNLRAEINYDNITLKLYPNEANSNYKEYTFKEYVYSKEAFKGSSLGESILYVSDEDWNSIHKK